MVISSSVNTISLSPVCKERGSQPCPSSFGRLQQCLTGLVPALSPLNAANCLAEPLLSADLLFPPRGTPMLQPLLCIYSCWLQLFVIF